MVYDSRRPFHGDNTGSNPVGDANSFQRLRTIRPDSLDSSFSAKRALLPYSAQPALLTSLMQRLSPLVEDVKISAIHEDSVSLAAGRLFEDAKVNHVA